ncbi:MAG: hypothetical protein ACFCAD_23195 [Pleurocapsa sp.]
MNFTYKSCLLLLGSFCLTTSISASVNALDNSSHHNSNNFINSSIHLAQNPKSNGKTSSREYTFKAPDSKKISNTEELVKIQGYKVEVYGSEKEL